MNASRSAVSGWWQGPLFERFLADLMRSELARLRPDLQVNTPPWNDATSFGSGPLRLDSLDRLKLASTVAMALHFSSAAVPDRLREMSSFAEWLAEARRVVAHTDGAVGFKSSGSSGSPAVVVHELTCLEQEVAVLAGWFASRTRIVASVPAHHVYGFLFTVLLPQVMECAVVDVRGGSPAALGAVLQPGDLLVAFPTVWEAAAGCGISWLDDVLGVSSGAACRPGLSDELRRGGLRGLYEIYGSTETGGIGWRTEGDAPFQLFEYWSKLDADHVRKAAGTYLLPDLVTWVTAERLIPRERRDRAVQVGGVNVYPLRARSVLLAHSGVAEAAVRLMRTEEGERLKAFIVPGDPGADQGRLQQSLVDCVETRLGAAERPRSFTFGAALPVSQAGKPADWSIHSQQEPGE